MNELVSIFLTWQFITFCFVIMGLFGIKYYFFHTRTPEQIKKYNMIKHQLGTGFLGLTASKKGILCMLLFFCSMIPMTILCFLGRIDGTAYGICLSAITTAVTTIYCHTQSKTDQILGTAQLPAPTTTETVISPSGTVTQNTSGPDAAINMIPVVPIIPTDPNQPPPQSNL